MPIYDFNGSAATEIGKMYDFNGSASAQIGKVYDNNGTASALIYTAEQQFQALSASLYNYLEYARLVSATSAQFMDLRGFNTLTFSCSLVCTMAWSNPYGLFSSSSAGLMFSDGAVQTICVKDGTLYTAGSSYSATFNGSLDISQTTEAQKSSVRLYIVNGYMSSGNPMPGQNRHDLVVTTSPIIAS